MVFKKFNENYHFISEWRSIRHFNKWYYWFFLAYRGKDQVAKKQYFILVLFGLLMQFAAPYAYKFSYKNMPKISGRRKLK